MAVPDRNRMKVRGGGLLLWDYVRYEKLTGLYVQYVRAMERRHVDRDEIRAPQHRLAADTIAELHAVDRDPAATWSEYERWLDDAASGAVAPLWHGGSPCSRHTIIGRLARSAADPCGISVSCDGPR